MSEAQRIAVQLDKIYDSDMTNRLVAALSSPSYTLADIEQLAVEYTDTLETTDCSKLSAQVMLLKFVEWLQIQEKGTSDGAT